MDPAFGSLFWDPSWPWSMRATHSSSEPPWIEAQGLPPDLHWSCPHELHCFQNPPNHSLLHPCVHLIHMSTLSQKPVVPFSVMHLWTIKNKENKRRIIVHREKTNQNVEILQDPTPINQLYKACLSPLVGLFLTFYFLHTKIWSVQNNNFGLRFTTKKWKLIMRAICWRLFLFYSCYFPQNFPASGKY